MAVVLKGVGLLKRAVLETTRPRWRGMSTVPSGPAPPASSSDRVAVIVPSQAPRGTKVKARDTGGPTGPIAPYDTGPPGDLTPPPGRRVATRSVVDPVPTLRKGTFRITVSSR